MSVTQILKTLSDTELMVIASEVNNPEISNADILDQLYSKSNLDRDVSWIGKVRDMDALNTLPEKLCLELSIRLKECNKR